ncbi:MAG: hypothetical protein D6775_12475 [Caldilineae bacterium]|nr:MAG: hypothetical protein D6775_12475 [Caldilineae bacterium]
MITTRVLDTENRRDVKTWIDLPYRIYKNHPLWVPQMVDEARLQLNRKKYPFYEHSDAEFIVAEKDGEPVGRIAALENGRYNSIRKERTGFFYLFECIEDFAVAEALFERACDWMRARGLNRIIGPKGFLTADGMGMLVEGFERMPAVGIAYNPPYYHDFMKRLGFEKETDYMSGMLDRSYTLPEKVIRIAEKVRNRYGFRVESYRSKKELKAIVPKVIDTYNAAFVNNWEFIPITESEAEVIAARLLDIIQPELIRLVWKGEDLAGFILCYPDINRGIQRCKGRLWPFGWYHLLREFGRTEWVNFNGAGILPQYQGRGVDAMLLTELAKVFYASRYKYAEIVQVEEGNERMQREMAAIGVSWDKRHRIFRKEL